MKNAWLSLVLAIGLGVGALGQGGGAPLQTLLTDLDAAKANAQLSDAQRVDLDKAMATLKSARETRMNGGTPDRGAMRGALQTIRKISQSGAFRAEDKEKIRKDIEALRSAAGGRRG
jgi:G:T/U-mismatch repair DNA glycosylase